MGVDEGGCGVGSAAELGFNWNTVVSGTFFVSVNVMSRTCFFLQEQRLRIGFLGQCSSISVTHSLLFPIPHPSFCVFLTPVSEICFLFFLKHFTSSEDYLCSSSFGVTSIHCWPLAVFFFPLYVWFWTLNCLWVWVSLGSLGRSNWFFRNVAGVWETSSVAVLCGLFFKLQQ